MWSWRRGLRWRRLPRQRPRLNESVLGAAAPAVAAHRRRWHRAAFGPRRRCPDHSEARQQLSQVRPFARGARGLPIGGDKRLERLPAITAFVFEKGHGGRFPVSSNQFPVKRELRIAKRESRYALATATEAGLSTSSPMV